MVFRSYAPATKIAAVRMSLEGFNQSTICNTLGYNISRQSFKRWMELFEQTKCVVRHPDTYATRGPHSSLTTDEIDFIIDLVRSEPGLFLSEIRELLWDANGPLLSIEAVHQNLVNRLSITLKKAGTSNIRKSLVAKFTYVEKMRLFPADWLVFTDESSYCDRDLLRTFARSARGTPAVRFVVNQNPERISLLPAITIGGLVALTTTTETFKRPQFEHFLEFDLIPRMNPYPGKNSVLVCNNATIHRGDRVKELCKQARIHILFLPPYCPELNPIELGFGAIKSHLRGTQVLSRTLDPRWEIRKAAAHIFTERFCSSIYKHCGYCLSVPSN